jgi:hypothetical protein
VAINYFIPTVAAISLIRVTFFKFEDYAPAASNISEFWFLNSIKAPALVH